MTTILCRLSVLPNQAAPGSLLHIQTRFQVCFTISLIVCWRTRCNSVVMTSPCRNQLNMWSIYFCGASVSVWSQSDSANSGPTPVQRRQILAQQWAIANCFLGILRMYTLDDFAYLARVVPTPVNTEVCKPMLLCSEPCFCWGPIMVGKILIFISFQIMRMRRTKRY